MTVEDCACRRQPPDDVPPLEAFKIIRDACPALREILLPDELWPQFVRWHNQPDNEALHRSILLLAMERGYLGDVISAVHRYLLNGRRLRPEASRQYCRDLREKWMLDSAPNRCNQKSRIFSGKLAELQFAEWLETQSWSVTSLEALGSPTDVVARAPDGSDLAAFEVKLIGVEDGDFAAIVRSIAGQPSSQSVSAYDPVNYLLFRAYEAAKQLQKVEFRRVAAVVIEELTWFRFDLQLEDGWIDWANPQFHTGHDWEKFLSSQRTRYPDLPEDLGITLHSVDALWILKWKEGYSFSREYVIPLASA